MKKKHARESVKVISGKWRAALLLALLGVFLSPGRSSPSEPASGRAAEAEVAFVYGVRAFNHEDWDEAVGRFSSAVEAAPENGELRYWLGLAFLALGDGERAETELEASQRVRHRAGVAATRLAGDLERARALRADGGGEKEIEPPGYRVEAISLRSLPRWEARIGVAAGSDSNPGLVPDGVAFDVGGETFAGPDTDTVLNLDLRGELHPFYDRGGWSLGLGIDGRLGLISDLSDLDFSRLRGVAQLAWGGDPLGYLVGPLGFTRVPSERKPFSLLLQGAFSENILDGNGFRQDLELASALTFREGRSTATQLDLSFRDESYDDGGIGDFDRDGEVTRARLSQYLYFGRRNAYVRLSASAGERDAGAAFDASSTEGRVELSLPAGPRAMVYLSGAVGRTDFDEVESNPLFPSFFADVPREDTTRRVTAAVTYALKPALWLTGRATVIDRESELGAAGGLIDLDYDRTVATIGIRWFTHGGGER